MTIHSEESFNAQNEMGSNSEIGNDSTSVPPIETENFSQDKPGHVPKRQETSDETPNTTTEDSSKKARHAINYQDDRIPTGTPIKYLRMCFEDSFDNIYELKNFCRERDIRIFPELPNEPTPQIFIEIIISYCDRHGLVSYLKDCLALERPHKYRFYYEEYGPEFDEINRVDRINRKSQSQFQEAINQDEKRTIQEIYENHLLTKENDPIKIQKWFFEELNHIQQSFVITATLFEGINRSEIYRLAKEIKQLLFEEVKIETPIETPENEEKEVINSGEININISVSPNEQKPLEKKMYEEVETETIRPTFGDDFDLLLATCVIVFPFRPTLTGGSTEVQKITFYGDSHRQKIIRLINQSLHSQLSKFYQFLFNMGFEGGNRHAEQRRRYAALGVGELMRVVSFDDLLKDIVRPWSRQSNFKANESAANALSYVANDYPEEVLSELKYWLSKTMFEIRFSALLTFNEIGQLYREHRDRTLGVIKWFLTGQKPFLTLTFDEGELVIVDENEFVLAALAMRIASNIYQRDPELVISHLLDWIVEADKEEESFLRYMASLQFLSIDRLDDVLGGGGVLDSLKDDYTPEVIYDLVDIIATLWEGESVPRSARAEVQEQATQLLERWAISALRAKEMKRIELFEAYRKLFFELYEVYENNGRRNYLDYYLRKWQKYREREQKYREREERSHPQRRSQRNQRKEEMVASVKQGSFLDLIPPKQKLILDS